MTQSKKKAAFIHKYPLDINENTSYLKVAFKKKVPKRYSTDFTLGGQLGSAAQSNNRASFGAVDTRILGTIYLPLPLGISDENSVSWGNSSLNAIEQGAVNAATDLFNNSVIGSEGGPKNIGELIQLASEKGGNYIQELANALKDPNVAGSATAIPTASILRLFGSNVKASDLYGRQTGQILNPHLELLFDGVNLRKHNFTFKFQPESQDESGEVKRIINRFKRAMAAKSDSVGPGGWFLASPDVFDLTFMRGGQQHPYLYAMKTCALEGIGVNYSDSSPDNYASYYDGSPVSVSMNLNFTELEPVYNEDYDGDYDTESLGKGVGY